MYDDVRLESRQSLVHQRLLPTISDLSTGRGDFNHEAWRLFDQRISASRLTHDHHIGVVEHLLCRAELHIAHIYAAGTATSGRGQPGGNVHRNLVVPFTCARERIDLAGDVLVLDRAYLLKPQVLLHAHG